MFEYVWNIIKIYKNVWVDLPVRRVMVSIKIWIKISCNVVNSSTSMPSKQQHYLWSSGNPERRRFHCCHLSNRTKFVKRGPNLGHFLLQIRTSMSLRSGPIPWSHRLISLSWKLSTCWAFQSMNFIIRCMLKKPNFHRSFFYMNLQTLFSPENWLVDKNKLFPCLAVKGKAGLLYK